MAKTGDTRHANNDGRPTRRDSLFRRVPIGAAGPQQPLRMEEAYFEAPVCRNCGEPLTTGFCGQCGQAKARRLTWRDLRHEIWLHWRLFEVTTARTLWRLISKPGYVAREYVLGRRKSHMHPLKLLLIMFGLMLLMVTTNRFFETHFYSKRTDDTVERMAALVQSYGNWSFSIGIFAIFLASWLVYRRRLGYNSIEHAVLAVYCQILIMGVILLNMLVTLVWDDPAFIADYKLVSGRYLYAAKVFIVGWAFRQFFLVDFKREWPRLLVAVLVYMALSWALLRVYALGILAMVRMQTA